MNCLKSAADQRDAHVMLGFLEDYPIDQILGGGRIACGWTCENQSSLTALISLPFISGGLGITANCEQGYDYTSLNNYERSSMLYAFSELSGSPLYPKYLQFRHRVFNGRLGYHQDGGPVSSFEAYPSLRPHAEWASGIEFDACDMPKTIHFAHISPVADPYIEPATYLSTFGGKVTGCVRMLPTDGRYMIRDAIEYSLWKNVPLFDDLPVSGDVYEVSRIAISPDLVSNDPARSQILDSLVYGHVELAIRLGVRSLIGVMHKGIWRTVYEKRGLPVRYLSQPFRIGGGHPVVIGALILESGLLESFGQHFSRQLAGDLVAAVHIAPELFLAHQQHVAGTGI